MQMVCVACVADVVLGNSANGRLLLTEDGGASDGNEAGGQPNNRWRSNLYAPQTTDVVLDELPSDFYRFQRLDWFISLWSDDLVIL